MKGLSPPVRGSHLVIPLYLPLYRSIPARAGKPGGRCGFLRPLRVYPRPCGEAVDPVSQIKPGQGLSPPVRGSPSSTARRTGQIGSIPAPCGEASDPEFQIVLRYGLSPPVRGSRDAECDGSRIRGSIPARAGKPARIEQEREVVEVYPRPCGEAQCQTP